MKSRKRVLVHVQQIGIGVAAGLAVIAAPVRAQAVHPARPAASGAITQPAAGAGFWKTVETYLQTTFANIGALGEGRKAPGQVFVAELEGLALRGPARAVSADVDLSWPVGAQDGTIYALKNLHVVRISPGKAPVAVGPQADWVKLIGVGPDGTVLGFVADPPFHRTASLAPSGAIVVGDRARSSDDEYRHGVLLQQSRAFADGARLRLIRSRRGGRGLDVLFERPGVGSVNVSDCGNDECGQPSLAPGGKRIFFVR